MQIERTLPKNPSVPQGHSRLSELDILRGIALTCVILVHVFAYYSLIAAETWVKPAAFFMCSVFGIGVPIFFFASGLVLARNYDQKFNALRFYLSRSISIVPLYLVACAVYLRLLPEMPSALNAALAVVNGSIVVDNTLSHLWFVPAIMWLYALFPALIVAIKRIQGRNAKYALLFALFSFSFAIQSGVIPQLIWDIRWFTTIQFVYGLAYFCMGAIVGESYQTAKESFKRLGMFQVTMLYLASLMAYSATNYLFTFKVQGIPISPFIASSLAWAPYSVVSILLALMASIRISESRVGLKPYAESLGRSSYSIFLFHALFITSSSRLLIASSVPVSAPEYYVLLSFMVFSLCLIFMRAKHWLMVMTTRAISYLPSKISRA